MQAIAKLRGPLVLLGGDRFVEFAHELHPQFAEVDAVLEATHGRKSEAARILGVNRRTLYRREERRAQEQAKAS